MICLSDGCRMQWANVNPSQGIFFSPAFCFLSMDRFHLVQMVKLRTKEVQNRGFVSHNVNAALYVVIKHATTSELGCAICNL